MLQLAGLSNSHSHASKIKRASSQLTGTQLEKQARGRRVLQRMQCNQSSYRAALHAARTSQ